MATDSALMRCTNTSRLSGAIHGNEAVGRDRATALARGPVTVAGKRPTQVAHAVGVARQTAYKWKAVLDEGGIDALRAMPARGRPARLDEQQLQSLSGMG